VKKSVFGSALIARENCIKRKIKEKMAQIRPLRNLIEEIEAGDLADLMHIEDIGFVVEVI
jgi:hypothetical protein